MRVLIQRVSRASVSVAGEECSSIDAGMLLFLGIESSDTDSDIDWLVGKISRLRIFDDSAGVMNLDITQVDGGVLLVSQFTLHASTRRGNRPSYVRAARPEVARPLFDRFVSRLSAVLSRPVATGVFGADMQVSLTNDGPVTILIDSKIRE